MSDTASGDGFWLFGYGSLIHDPNLPFEARVPARLHGFSRRFWQGSHDHRGLPQAPGRVVTLIESREACCTGMAYRVPGAAAAAMLERLDRREQNGYQRQQHTLTSADGRRFEALVYIAEPGNFAWLGPAPMAQIARQIHAARGPSGRNSHYLLALAASLRELGTVGDADDHVFELERRVQRLAGCHATIFQPSPGTQR